VALKAAGALAGQPVAAVGPADDRPGPGVGLRAWLSLSSSTTTLAPKVAYCSSRRTHWYSSTGDRSRAGSAPGLSAINTGSRLGMAGWPPRWRAASMARWRTASGLRAGMPRPWRVKAFAQRRPGGGELLGGGVDAAELLGQLEGALGLAAVGQESAGLPAQRTSTKNRLVRDSRCRVGTIGSHLGIGFLIGYVRSFDIRIITMMRSVWENPARRPRITRRWWAPPGMQDEENQQA
jgi:hypothetical protein